MNNRTALIIYNEIDIPKNIWFINHLKNCLSDNNVDSMLITTAEFYHQNDNFLTNADFIINRSRDYEISLFFENNGIRSFNSSEIIRIANDKDLTYKHLSEHNISFLPYITIPTEFILDASNDIILSVACEFGFPFVFKPAEGHGGAHVYLVSNQDEFIEIINNINFEINSKSLSYKKFLIQKPSNTLGKDLRVYILNNNIYASILRSSSKDFRANFSLGGATEEYKLSEHEIAQVNEIIKHMPSDLCGIDFVYNSKEIIINEVEDAVGTRMLYSNTSFDIVNDYVKYIIKQIKKP